MLYVYKQEISFVLENNFIDRDCEKSIKINFYKNLKKIITFLGINTSVIERKLRELWKNWRFWDTFSSWLWILM